MFKRGLTFDDVCLVPQKSNIRSRSEPSLFTKVTGPDWNYSANIPIFASPMDTVLSPSLASILTDAGSFPIFPRTTPLKSLYSSKSFFISVGLDYNLDEIKDLFYNNDGHLLGINVDLANGHSVVCLETVEKLRKELPPRITIMAGAVCTVEGYNDLVNAGCNSVRVNIGGGSACITREVTGYGVPLFTALYDIGQAAKNVGIPFLCDGGIRKGADIVKALGAGAAGVMIGGLFAGTNESAAKKRTNSFGVLEAFYRGQASANYQEDIYGGLKSIPEGEAGWVPVSGPAATLIDDLCKAVRTALSYAGASTIVEFQKIAEFMEVTPSYLIESKARILG